MVDAILCDAFVRVSRGVWRWMRRAATVPNPQASGRRRSMQLHEQFLTDYTVLRLLEEVPSSLLQVITFTPRQEARLGADMEMWFHQQGWWLGIRIQAKVLKDGREFPNLHEGSGQQTATLIQEAANNGMLPLYLLYLGPYQPGLWSHNPCDCPVCRRVCDVNVVFWGFGNWWISAYAVQKLYPSTALRHLWKYMSPWQCLICCPWRPTLDALIENAAWRRLWVPPQGEWRVKRRNEIPDYVQAVLEGKDVESAESDEKMSLPRHLLIWDMDALVEGAEE